MRYFYLILIVFFIGCKDFTINSNQQKVENNNIVVEKEQMINSNQKLDHLFLETTFKNKTLSSVTQAGFVNNLNE
jgi:hypothetical protein